MKISIQMFDLEVNYPKIWNNMQFDYLNHSTGKTESVMFNYISNHTLSEPEKFYHSQDIFCGGYGR